MSATPAMRSGRRSVTEAGPGMPTHEPLPERAELIGRGFCSDVYAWGPGRVLKLFHGPIVRSRANREFTATRAVHAAGLPVPAAYEMVEVEGRIGIVFERVQGVSLFGYTWARPWAVFDAVRQLAELHARIHRCPAPAGLPSLRERIAERVELSDAPEADKRAAQDRLAALPDGTALCHGDFHPDNVLRTARGLVVIDWSSASHGDPLGDVACTWRLIRTANLPPWAPGYTHLLLRCLRSAIQRSYLKRYFRLNAGTRRQVEAWQAPLAVAARSWRAARTWVESHPPAEIPHA
jgi:aminoglycoside phosphotransferase (APT) family kinase protein